MNSADERTAPMVIGLGEVFWDIFPDARRLGGATANVAFHAQQLGCNGIVASRVGMDTAGDELCAHLREKRLDTRLIQRDVEHPTGRVTVDLSNPQRPRYVIHEDVACDYLATEETLLQAAREARAICFGTLAQRMPVSRETIHAVLAEAAQECLIVYDVNLRQHWYRREWIERSLRCADVVKINHEEAAIVGPLLELPRGDDRVFAAAVRERYGVELACVTRAEEGCLLVGPDGVADVPGVAVDVVDSVGAGDAFTAALIAAQLDGWPLHATADFANQVGALVTTRAGATPEMSEEFARLRNHSPIE